MPVRTLAIRLIGALGPEETHPGAADSGSTVNEVSGDCPGVSRPGVAGVILSTRVTGTSIAAGPTVATILIVDDSPTLRRMLKKELLAMGHQVVDAADGPSALAALEGQPFELVISDVNMAPMDGFSLVSRIRTTRPREQLPILFFTTEASDQMKHRGRAAGANGWLTKPLVPERLSLALNHLLVRT